MKIYPKLLSSWRKMYIKMFIFDVSKIQNCQLAAIQMKNYIHVLGVLVWLVSLGRQSFCIHVSVCATVCRVWTMQYYIRSLYSIGPVSVQSKTTEVCMYQ